MSKVLPSDDRNRRIPQSKSEGTFDQDLFDTLKETILQVGGIEERLDDLGGGDSGPSDEFTDALDAVEARLDEVTEDIDRLEEELDAIETETETPELTAADLSINSLAVGDVQSPMDGVMRAEKGAALGPNTSAASHYLDIWSRQADHIRLAGPNAEAELFASDGKLGLSSDVIELDAGAVNPAEDYQTSLGSEQNKFLSLHTAELWTESLVAQKKTATIGGSVFVGPTTKLKEPLSSSEDDAHYRPHKDQYNYIRVEHGQMSEGDIIQLEARGRVEFMRVISGRTELESPEGEDPLEIGSGLYRYEVERDLDGTGPNTWKEGDAVASTGRKGSGFIDLYAQRSKRSENESGPSIAISVREEDASTWDGAENEYYNEWGERSALGNLDGLYDFTGDVYGVAGGRYEDAWFSVDENQGFRLMNQDTLVGQWATDGTVRVGPYRQDISTHPLVIQPDGTLTTYGDLRLPDGDGGYQRPANWQGPWMAGVSYDKGDAVSYQGQTYICVTAHTSSVTDGQNATGEPDDSAYWDAMAEAAEQAYISTPKGSAVKNSTSNLEVKAKLITGPEEKTLSGTSGYTFVDEDGTDISTYATQVTSGELHYELTPSQIGSSLVIHLEDPSGNQVGTTTLIDITESIIGTTTVLSGDRSYYRPPGGSWETGTTTFEAQFIQGPSVVATAEAHVSWNGSSFTLEKDPTGSNPGSITVSGTDEGNAYTLRFEYTNPSGIVQHAETNVLAIEGGTDSQLVRIEAPSRVFKQKKDGSHYPSDITLEAHTEGDAPARPSWRLPGAPAPAIRPRQTSAERAWQHGRKGGPGRAAEASQEGLTGSHRRVYLLSRAPPT